jgi:hypothetical protein
MIVIANFFSCGIKYDCLFFVCDIKFQIWVYYPSSQITEFISIKKKTNADVWTQLYQQQNNFILYFNHNNDFNNFNIWTS